MKLVLLQPPIQDFYDTGIRLQPIGLAYLKSAVKKFLPGIEVVIKDYHHGWGRRTVSMPQELAYLKEFYAWPDRSPFSSFHQYYHFGADFESLARDVAGEKPDLVGISSLFSPYYREVLRAAEAIKRRRNVPIILGGSHVSALPNRMLEPESVDFVIRGEGERPLVEFLKSWNNGRHFELVPNLGFKKDGKMILNSLEENYPIEDLPEPDLSDFSPGDYLFEKRPLSFVITSRSCPHRCSFCSVHKTFGFRYRRRSVGRVLEEIQRRYEDGVRVFDFEDDNLTYYKEDMKELCRRLAAVFPKQDVQFLAMNGISYLSLDEELLRLMKQAGFTHLNLALVSSDVTVRETTKRPHTVKKYEEVVACAFRMGFKVVSYQILGLPNESLDSMIQTLLFSARQPVLLGASLFYLTPDSPIARSFPEATESDVLKSRLTAMAIETESFAREDLYTLFLTTRILNYLKGLEFEAEVLSFKEALEISRNQGVRSALGVDILQKLLNGEGFYASTNQGYRKIHRFREPLFSRVWSDLEKIRTQDGKWILLNP